MKKILGIDIGSNSLGWALLDTENHSILDCGVRIFQDEQKVKDESVGKSKNEERRNARICRRQIFRKIFRKKILLKILKENNIFDLNAENKEAFFFLNPYYLREQSLVRKISLEELSRILYLIAQRRGFLSNRKNPRHADKDIAGVVEQGMKKTIEAVGERTLGQFFNELHPKRNQPFKQTERIRSRFVPRELYVREFEKIWDYQSQFYPDILNKELKKKIGDPKKGILFYQRPLKSQKHLLGKCMFEPTKTRCPISRIEFEEFRLYQFLNNLEIDGNPLTKTQIQTLVAEIINKQSRIKILQAKKILKVENSKMNYEDDTEIPNTPTLYVVNKFFPKKYFLNYLEVEQQKKLERFWELVYFAKDTEWLLNSLKKEKAFPEDAKLNMIYDKKRTVLISNYIPKNDYSSLSLKAIKNILPFLKMGFQYNVAVILGGVKNSFGNNFQKLSEAKINEIIDIITQITSEKHPENLLMEKIKTRLISNYGEYNPNFNKLYHRTGEFEQNEIKDYLPKVESLRNPRVEKALNQLTKVINPLIDKYGKPDKVVIEIATELKMSKEKIKQYQKQLRINESINKKAKDFLDMKGLAHSRDNLHKYRLYYEIEKRHGSVICPYSGKPISIDNLFSANPQFEIEHILPFSRTLNDSLDNKTLCEITLNKLKGNRTPYEFFTSIDEDWETIAKRAFDLLPYTKAKRFVSKNNIDVDEFISNQLNDTRYISKKTKEYFEILGVKVQVIAGKITSIIRGAWGLNSILATSIEELKKENADLNLKNRADHRHHAIDAITLSVVELGTAQIISKLSGKDVTPRKLKIPEPWDNFKTDVQEAVAHIIVSQYQKNNLLNKSKKKIIKNGKSYYAESMSPRGPLHKETFYGRHWDPVAKDYYFHSRKPIDSLTQLSQIKKIADPELRRKILVYLNSNGYLDNNKITQNAFFKKDAEGKIKPKFFLPNQRGEKVPVLRIRLKEPKNSSWQIKSENNKWVEVDSNHHAEIFKRSDGTYYQKLVTFDEAVIRKQQGLPVVATNPTNGDTFIGALRKNDVFLLGIEPEFNWSLLPKSKLIKHLYRVQNLSFQSNVEIPDYTFRHILAATIDYDSQKQRISSFKRWNELNPIKVRISTIGEIFAI